MKLHLIWIYCLFLATLGAAPNELSVSNGYDFYRTAVFPLHEQEFFRLAKEGQTPKTLFIGCSDSRIIPELFTSTGPGELFVIRTAGNFVPDQRPEDCGDGVGATIEYAVNVLGIKEIIVCGHSHCGAISALFMDQDALRKKMPLVAKWIQFGNLAKEATLKLAKPGTPKNVLEKMCEQLSVVEQLVHLLSYPLIKEKVLNKEIYLHGWYFDISTGSVEYFDPEQKRFIELR